MYMYCQVQYSIVLVCRVNDPLVSRVHLVSLHVEGLAELLFEQLMLVLLVPLLHLPQLICVV